MKLSLNSTLAALVLSFPLLASATEYEIDPQHSGAEFGIKHLGLSTVKGRFSNVTGIINLDDKDPSKSNVQASIDATTINTDVAPRDAHLKSPDFFDVEKFPTITFKSTKVEKAGEGLNVTGDLTMHGVTKPVVLNVTDLTPETMAMGKARRAATATTKLNRKEFGLGWNKVIEAGGLAVADDVKIEINLEMNKKGAEAAPAAPAKPATPPAKKP